MEESQTLNGKSCDLAANSSDNVDGELKDIITLEECFKSIVQGNSIEVEIDNLNSILRRDLQVNFYYLKPKLKYAIPYMLVHYIKCWPGWQKNNHYLSKQLTFDNWFAKFKEYLVFKINYLIKNDFEKVQSLVKANPAIDESILFKIDNSTQISIPSEKSIAPYTIDIQGLPKMLNSLIFCEGPNDSIIVKEYKMPVLVTLTTKQLLNWPYVEVDFLSTDLNFKRKNMHEFKRYLMLSNEKITFKKMETFIEEIEIVNEQITRAVYTLNVLREYCDTYIDVLKKHQKMMEVTDEYIADIKTIFDEFVLDIAELNMDSMATNTSVLFNVGKYIYARNKSVRTSGHAVCFAESITPKVNISLLHFTGLKDETSDTPFQGLQDVLDSSDKDFVKAFLPVLQFSCTFCKTRYDKKSDILDHFERKHCMEQPVLCFKCKLQMELPIICQNRWNHQCRHQNNYADNSVTR